GAEVVFPSVPDCGKLFRDRKAAFNRIAPLKPVFGTIKVVLAMLLPFVAAMAAIPADEIAVGRPFPTLRAEFLTGRTAVLPDAATGKVSLLLLGFSYDSRWAVEAWAERFRHQFGADERVTFFEIPIIGGISKLAKWFIDSGMRKGTPKPDQEHVITLYHDSDLWKRRVGFHDPKAAYLVLLDGHGSVAWRQN